MKSVLRWLTPWSPKIGKEECEMIKPNVIDSVSVPDEGKLSGIPSVSVPDEGKLAEITIEKLSCPKCNREFAGFVHNIKTIFFKCHCGKKFDESQKLKKNMFVSFKCM